MQTETRAGQPSPGPTALPLLYHLPFGENLSRWMKVIWFLLESILSLIAHVCLCGCFCVCKWVCETFLSWAALHFNSLNFYFYGKTIAEMKASSHSSIPLTPKRAEQDAAITSAFSLKKVAILMRGWILELKAFKYMPEEWSGTTNYGICRTSGVPTLCSDYTIIQKWPLNFGISHLR